MAGCMCKGDDGVELASGCIQRQIGILHSYGYVKIENPELRERPFRSLMRDDS